MCLAIRAAQFAPHPDAGCGPVYVPSPDEKEAFEDATAGIKDWFVAHHGDTWLIKLEKAVSDCEDAIEAEYAEFIED